MNAERVTSEELRDAWVYLLSRALVDRQEKIDLAEEGVDYNVIKYNPLNSAGFVNPNFDVAYVEAWLAVDDENPVILHVPDCAGRYYTAQLLDEWGEVITNINDRLFPDTPSGDFVLHAPGVAPPNDAGVPVELHSRKAKLLGRVELVGDDAEVEALQHRFAVRSLGTPTIDPPTGMPKFEDDALPGVGLFDYAEALLAVPDPTGSSEMQGLVRKVAAAASSSPEISAGFDAQLRGEIIPQFEKDAVTKPGRFDNGWLAIVGGGHYGDDWYTRTAANRVGIWANEPGEVIYYIGSFDAEHQPLSGGVAYAIHFPADSLPDDQCDAYWSITMLSATDFRVIENPIDRYTLSSHSPLERESDGSLQLDLAPIPVVGRPEANWLPSPASGDMSITIRNYRPNRASRDPLWFPPALVRTDR